MKLGALRPIYPHLLTLSAFLLLAFDASPSKAEENCKNMPNAGFAATMSALQDKIVEAEAENGKRKPTDPLPEDNAKRYFATLKGYIAGCHAGEVIDIPDYFETMVADLCDFSKSIYSGKTEVICVMRTH